MNPVGSPTASSSQGPPSFMTFDIEIDKTLASLDNFAVEGGEVGCGGRRGKKSSPVASPIKKRLSNLFKRNGGRHGQPKALIQPPNQEEMKSSKVLDKKTGTVDREAYTIVRAPPRAVLKTHDVSSSRHHRSPRRQHKASPFRNQRLSTTQKPSSVGQKLPNSPATCSDIKLHSETHQFNTPVSRPPKLGNILELSTVCRSVKFNGTPVAHSRECNFIVNSQHGVNSPKVKAKMIASTPSPRQPMSDMMKSLKCQTGSRDKADDDNESDTSTIHLLTLDELAQQLVCESNEVERLEDPCIPPTLTITTSRMSTTSVLGASTTSFLGDSGLVFYDEDTPTTPAAPITDETTFSSSVHTLKWSSYHNYYDGPLSPPSPLRERWSNASHNNPEAVKGDPEIQRASRQAPPFVSNVSSSSGSSNPSIRSIEVVPGHSVAIRGADETLLYVAADATAEKSLITTNQCMVCTSTFHCVWDAEFMLCPVCLTVQSTQTVDDTQGWGVGLGFLPGDWESWKKSLAVNGL